MKPLCFVLMPFGTKKDPGTGLDIDFRRRRPRLGSRTIQQMIEEQVALYGCLRTHIDPGGPGGHAVLLLYQPPEASQRSR